MNSRVLRASILSLSIVASAASAAIVVTPTNPAPFQNVRIELVTQYFSATSITSATIVRAGNQFTINQSVSESCFLPSAPLLTSTFDVGPLPAGTYQITAVTQNTRPCGSFTTTENASFAVIEPHATPIGGPLGYATLAGLLVMFGVRRLRSTVRA
jgi:hypothetical protein